MQISRRRLLDFALTVPLAPLFPLPLGAAAGRFEGGVVARWSNDGRTMTLTEAFGYVSPDGRRWPVPAGTVIDGASIPRVFWSIIGGPFEGSYRNASVVHDHYCNVRTRRFRDVHRMFYDAMLTSGVADTKAWVMFQAVDQFGPRWSDPKIDRRCEVVDENYDFKACARNFSRPPRQDPPLGRADLEAFLRQVEAKADPADVARLRQALPSR